MNRLGILLIVIALIFSAILSGLVYRRHHAHPAISQPPEKVSVLVATRNLNLGVILKDSDMAWHEWPRNATSSNMIIEGVRNKENFIGAIVREAINEGQPLTDTMVVSKENLNPLSGILKPGMRAYTIGVTIPASIGGLITSGDTVDVILTYSYIKSGSTEKNFITRTILTSITVLAVDLDISPVQTTGKTTTKNSVTNSTHNITLEVTPQEAEILALGQSMGTLSLSLSSPINVNTQPVPSTLLEGTDLTNTGVVKEKEKRKVDMILIHGEKLENINNGS